MSSTFGQIVIPTQIEYAVRDILIKYFPTYLREVERVLEWEREPLPAPRNFVTRNSFDAQPGEEIPKAVVYCPGLVEAPKHLEGDGYYGALWNIGIGVATAASTEEMANTQAKMYGTAARSILLQHQDLELPDIVTEVIWLDESYPDLELEGQIAQYRAASIFVGVRVPQVVNRFNRPPEVTEAPQILSTVEEVIADIDLDPPTHHGIEVVTN